MALTLSNLYHYAVDVGTSQQLVAAALCNAVIPILTESSGTTNHSLRVALAQKTLLDPLSMAKKVVWAVLADATVAAAMPTPTDAQIQAAVNALISNDALLNA